MTEAFSLRHCFAYLPDPRVSRRCTYRLTDVIIIAICGVLCGADSWVGVDMVGREKEACFRKFLDLEHRVRAWGRQQAEMHPLMVVCLRACQRQAPTKTRLKSGLGGAGRRTA